jgi:hypothetical protein
MAQSIRKHISMMGSEPPEKNVVMFFPPETSNRSLDLVFSTERRRLTHDTLDPVKDFHHVSRGLDWKGTGGSPNRIWQQSDQLFEVYRHNIVGRDRS